MLIRSLVAVAMLLQAACASTALTDFRTVVVSAAKIETIVGQQDLSLRSGQIIVSESSSSMSFMMNLMVADYEPYGHAGIIVLEPNGVFVYEAFGFLNFQLWKPPTHRLHGKIRRVPLMSFLKRSVVSAIYEHDNIELDAIAEFARNAHRQRLAFDGLFDYRTPDSVYCSEFVAAALFAAGHEKIRPTPSTHNASLQRTMAWLDLNAPGFILASRLLSGATEVALISERYSRAQIEVHFAFERELHERFSTDQKLGNVFRWTAGGPRLRPHLIALRERLMAGANSADDPVSWVAQQVALFLRPKTTATLSE